LLRVFVVWDRQPSGGPIPNYSDIFSSFGLDIAPTGQSSIYSAGNPVNMGRFVILYDKYFDMNAMAYPGPNTADFCRVSKHCGFEIDLTGLRTVFTPNGGSYEADVMSGNVIFGIRSSLTDPTPGVEGPSDSQFTLRMEYYDN